MEINPRQNLRRHAWAATARIGAAFSPAYRDWADYIIVEDGRPNRRIEAASYGRQKVSPIDGGPGAMLDAANNDQSDVEQARAELMRIGRKQWPRLSEAQVFEAAFTDPRNAAIVARLYHRPLPTSIYPMPREWLAGEGSQHEKADRGSAYGELMAKAAEHRNAHPDLSIAQCFEKIYTDRANVELAKRERAESAPR
jgi:hypothetical protein